MKKVYFLLFLFCFSATAFATTHYYYGPKTAGAITGGGTFCGTTTTTLSFVVNDCQTSGASANTGDAISQICWYVNTVSPSFTGATLYQNAACVPTTCAAATTTTFKKSITQTAVGTYYYACQITYTSSTTTNSCSPTGGMISSAFATVTVKPNPSAISLPSPLCPGNSYTLTNTLAGGTWTTSASNVISLTPTTGASTTVTTVTNGASTITYNVNGCTASTNASVSIGPTPVTVTPATSTVCSGVAVALSASGGTIPNRDTIFFQNFNTPPIPWFIDNTQMAASNTWGWQREPNGWADPNGGPALNPPDASAFYVVCADCAGVQETWSKAVTFPTFSLSGFSSATLTYQDYYDGYSGDDYNVEVDISLDGGITFQPTPVSDYTPGVSSGSATSWATETFDLTPYVGHSNVALRFNYNSFFGEYWAIDNVLVYGPGASQEPITWTPATNLSCNSCTNPVATPSVTTTYTATAIYAQDGCTTHGASAITVNPSPTASLTPSGSPITGCGTSQLITASTNTAGAVYQWYVPGSPVTGATNATYSVPANGSYYVNVRNPTSGCNTNSQQVVVNFNPIPSASISPSVATSACGSNITLTAGSDIGNVYQWNNGSTPIVNATNATYTATVSGSYNVTIWKYGVTCNSTSPTALITIRPIPASSVDPSGTVTACGSQILTAITDIGNTYQWYASGVPIIGATNNTYTATGSDLYSVQIGTNPGSCSLMSGQTNVTVKTAPTASITTPSNALSACAGLLMTGNSNLGTVYQWYNSAGAISGAVNPTYSVTTTDNYYVAITYTATGCTANSPVDHISINPFPVASINAPGETTVCEGSSVLFVANTGTGITYQWVENGIIQVGNVLNTYSATTAGSYEVIEQAGYNCADTSNVLMMSTYPNPTASVIPDGSTSFCEGGSVALYANASPGVTYQWLLNSNDIPTGITDTINAASDGIYTVKVTSGNNCSYVSPGITVTVHTPPVPYLIPGGTVYICDSSFITLSANTTGIATYQWYNNTNAIVDAINSTYNAGVQGSYNVVETDINGCTANSSNVIVNVNPLPNPIVVQSGTTLSTTIIYQTYQWYLNGLPIQGATNSTYDAPVDGAYTVEISNANGCFGSSAIQWVINVGVPSVSAETAVSVYPNPNSGMFSLNGTMDTKDNKIQIQISAIDGKVILTDKFEAKNGLINEQLSIDENMPSGMYMIRLVSDEKTVVLPFVKK